MAKSCVRIPRVTDRDGNKKESRLFQDLLSYLKDRTETVEIYQKIKNPKFNQVYGNRLSYDEFNEPTLESLIKYTNLEQVSTRSKTIDMLKRQIGTYKRNSDEIAKWIMSEENYQKLRDKVIQFNTTSPYKDNYVARIIQMSDSESNRAFYGITVEARNKQNSLEADKLTYNYKLNEVLKDILASKGVSIGALTDLEKRLGISGVADLDVAREAADGLIELIRLADGIRGEKALPEEFAHIALEALAESPLVNRLLNILNNKNLIEEILGDEYEAYSVQYKGDSVKLAKEAAGKLLAKHLLNAVPIEPKPYKSILERVIQAVKNFFKRFNLSEIQRAKDSLDKEFADLAKTIIDTRGANIDIDNIKVTKGSKFFSLDERVQRDKKILGNIIRDYAKRLKIFEARNPNSKFDVVQQATMLSLQKKLEEGLFLEGLYEYCESAVADLNKVKIRLESLKSEEGGINQKAAVLRSARDYIYSYKNTTEELREALREEEIEADNRYGEKMRLILNDINTSIDDLLIDFKKQALPLFVDFLKPFIGEKIEIPFGKGKTLITPESLETLVKEASKDVSIFNAWLDSMANSSDFTLKLLDKTVKKSKDNKRLRVLELSKEIQKLGMILRQSGIFNTDWMYERDENGNYTPNFISEINQTKFFNSRKAMEESLIEKYGENPIGQDALKYKAERSKWYKENTEIVNGQRVPKMSIYGNKDFMNLTQAQKDYYQKIMEIRETLLSYLPENILGKDKFRAPQIRKDLLERVLSSKNPKDTGLQLWENLRDQLVSRVDDTEFGTLTGIKDFEGREVNTLPIYYTKKLERPEDLSHDVTSTMIAFAEMAINYDEMSKVIDALELGRILLNSRKIQATRSNKPLIELIEVGDQKISSTINKGESNYSRTLNEFFNTKVYGKAIKDEGEILGISTGKGVNFINKLTSLNHLALNLLSNVAASTSDVFNIVIEASGGRFFSFKDLRKGLQIYNSNLPGVLGEIGGRIKTNKLNLFSELFNISQDADSQNKDIQWRKGRLAKFFRTDTLFFGGRAGEHFGNTITALALANRYKLKDPSGNEVSLWDALEEVYLDPNNKKLGAKLQIKPGYTKLNGQPFTNDDITAFSKRIAGINHELYGIYNTGDKSMIHSYAVGRLVMLFRNYLVPSLRRRFGASSYSFDLDAEVEGYYRTAGRFLNQLRKDLKSGKLIVATRWNELTNTEKSNIKKALTETSIYLSLSLILALSDAFGDDDKNRPWLKRFLTYELNRVHTELGALTPTPKLPQEMWTILKSPAASMSTFESLGNLVDLANPLNYLESSEIKSGRFKGHTKAYKSFMESPFFPTSKTIYRILNPEEIQY